MKRLIAATIALTLLGSTAAMADGWHGRDSRYGRGYDHHHDNVGPAIAVGLGVAALAIIASQHDDHHEGYYSRGYYGRGYYGRGDGYYYRERGHYDRAYYDRHREDDDD